MDCTDLVHPAGGRMRSGLLCALFPETFALPLQMEQVFTVNEAIFARSVIHSEALDEIPQRLVDGVFNEICELVPVEGLALAVYDEESHILNYAFYRGEGDEVVRERMARCFEKQVQMWNDVTGWTLLPLWVEIGGERHCMGVLALK